MNVFDSFRVRIAKALLPADHRGGWFSIVKESYPGAWQQNVEIKFDSVLSNHAVYACATLIASDVSKLRVKLIEQDASGVWTETENPAYSPVLRKPNRFQTRIQFWESYILSKLLRGNTYVIKQRDNRGVVTGLYVLDPCRVKPLISEDGQIFYDVQADNVSGIEEAIVVPASEIIHDRFNCLFHPLCGVSPIYANGLTATQALSIQKNATLFFENAALPGGVLLAPGNIEEKDVERVKAAWENKYSGSNTGRIAVLGSGMKFERMTMTSVESQMIEQLKWTAQVICSTFHVPPYKIGVGDFPPYTNVQAGNLQYYIDGLQSLIEAAEVCLDEGLGLGTNLGVEFDVDGLLRMDSLTQMDVLTKASGIMKINEKRKRLDLPAVAGGDDIYLQQQDFSLSALRKRDAKDDPFATAQPQDNEEDDAADEDDDETIDEVAAAFGAFELKTQLDRYIAA